MVPPCRLSSRPVLKVFTEKIIDHQPTSEAEFAAVVRKIVA
jgi:hypothetical protein